MPFGVFRVTFFGCYGRTVARFHHTLDKYFDNCISVSVINSFNLINTFHFGDTVKLYTHQEAYSSDSKDPNKSYPFLNVDQRFGGSMTPYVARKGGKYTLSFRVTHLWIISQRCTRMQSLLAFPRRPIKGTENFERCSIIMKKLDAVGTPRKVGV